MSRKPIDQQQPSECRQAVWDAIKASSGLFTIPNIAKDVRLEVSTVRDYIIGLEKAGFIEMAEKHSLGGAAVMISYRLVRDIGIEAPRVRKDGTIVTQGQGRQNMWQAMRILKEFSVTDLAFNSSTDDHSVAVNEAKTYCALLCKAGYLAGQSGQRYRLLPSMWTGPLPPQIQRTKQVYDPNLKRVVWSRIEGGAE